MQDWKLQGPPPLCSVTEKSTYNTCCDVFLPPNGQMLDNNAVCTRSVSSTDLVVTAAAQVVGHGDLGIGRQWRWCHFLWHAGLERRLFEHIIQASICPVVRSWFQPQQVWHRDKQGKGGSMFRESAVFCWCRALKSKPTVIIMRSWSCGLHESFSKTSWIKLSTFSGCW